MDVSLQSLNCYSYLYQLYCLSRLVLDCIVGENLLLVQPLHI